MAKVLKNNFTKYTIYVIFNILYLLYYSLQFLQIINVGRVARFYRCLTNTYKITLDAAIYFDQKRPCHETLSNESTAKSAFTS